MRMAPASAAMARRSGTVSNRNHPLRAEQESTADRELCDRAAAEYGDGLAALDFAVLRRHIAGRENVGQEQHLLVREALRHLHRADIGKRHAQIFCLTGQEAAQQVRITEQARRRVTPEPGRGRCVRVGTLATRVEAALAEEALAAGDRERHDDTVALLLPGYIFADLEHLAYRLVADHVAALHCGDDAVVEMQIRAADRACRDLDDRVARLLDLRIGHAFAPHVMLAMPSDCFHGFCPAAAPCNDGGDRGVATMPQVCSVALCRGADDTSAKRVRSR